MVSMKRGVEQLIIGRAPLPPQHQAFGLAMPPAAHAAENSRANEDFSTVPFLITYEKRFTKDEIAAIAKDTISSEGTDPRLLMLFVDSVPKAERLRIRETVRRSADEGSTLPKGRRSSPEPGASHRIDSAGHLRGTPAAPTGPMTSFRGGVA